MEVNEGFADRLVRLVLAVLILVMFLTGNLPGYWALLLILTGTFTMTAITGYCPLYKPLGMNTCKK